MTDAAILSIPDNSTYEINLYSETAEELTVIVYTPTSLETISYTLMKRPYTNAELSSGLFPVLILPNSHDLADLANSISLGFLDVTWQNSATADVSYLGLLWWDGSGQQEIGSLILPGITSHRFDSSTGYLAPVDWGILGLFGEDHYDRVLAHVWQFSE